MKKIFPILAVLGSAAALIAYKMKKEEEKQIIDLDQGLLYDDEPEDNEDAAEEAPISDPQHCCEEVNEAFMKVWMNLKMCKAHRMMKQKRKHKKSMMKCLRI